MGIHHQRLAGEAHAGGLPPRGKTIRLALYVSRGVCSSIGKLMETCLCAHSWTREVGVLPLREVLRVGDEFRVGAGPQFIEIHTQSLAVWRDPLRVNSIQQPVQTVR
jgi:hypothetical protein